MPATADTDAASRGRRVNATLLDLLARLDDPTYSGFLNGRPTSTR